MRNNSDKDAIEKFMDTLGMIIKKPVNVYFNGGATAVMLNIRNTTIDIDIVFFPESDEMYRAIQLLKETLNINIELASPLGFLPPLPKWKERSIFIKNVKNVSFFHFDLYSQIIAKIQRGWALDMQDVNGFAAYSIDLVFLKNLFQKIKPMFIKYPVVDVSALEKKIEKFITSA